MKDWADRAVEYSWAAMRGCFRGVLFRGSIALSPKKRLAGFEVVNCSDAADWEALCSRIAQALDLIAAFDEPRFRRMRRAFKRIMLMPRGGSAGSYYRENAACALAENHVRDDSIGSIAMTLVHEGAHSRIDHLGVPYLRHLRARIEHMCVAEEIEFARRAPGLDALINSAKADLEKGWWDDDSDKKRRDEQLRSLGLRRR